jgi:hypothetical protein
MTHFVEQSPVYAGSREHKLDSSIYTDTGIFKL